MKNRLVFRKFNFIFFFYITVCISCKNDSNKKFEIKPKAIHPDTSDIVKRKPEVKKLIFWEKLCSIKGFEICAECEGKNRIYESYQISLANDPFKDFIIIKIHCENGIIKEIFKFKFAIEEVFSKQTLKKYSNYFTFNHFNGHLLYCYYSIPKKIVSIRNKKNINKLNVFFNQRIWTMPEKDSAGPYLDPETWSVIAIKGDNYKEISRHSEKDIFYYENIQFLLDICNIKEYRFKRESLK